MGRGRVRARARVSIGFEGQCIHYRYGVYDIRYGVQAARHRCITMTPPA